MRLITVKEAASRLHIQDYMVYRMLAAGFLRRVYLGPKTYRLFSVDVSNIKRQRRSVRSS